jgi:hypothetical protein
LASISGHIAYSPTLMMEAEATVVNPSYLAKVTGENLNQVN